MNSINKTVFVGNLTRDAELSYTNSGFAICKMSIAISIPKKVGDKWEDEASFFDLVGLGKRYEALANYLTRGSKIAVDCHAKQERWEKDGMKRSKVVFQIDNIELVGGKSEAKQSNDYSPKTDPGYSNGGFQDDPPF